MPSVRTMTMVAQPPLPESPSRLADSLANIRLDDQTLASVTSQLDGDDDDVTTEGHAAPHGIKASSEATSSSPPLPDPSSIAESLKQIAAGLDAIRSQFFTIQEKRHAGVFVMIDNASSSDPAKPSKTRASEKSVALDLEMARLTGLMEYVSETLGKTEAALRTLDGSSAPGLQRRSSVTSLSSLESFDEVFGVESLGIRRDPIALRKQHAELTQDWSAVQSEAKTLEEELSGDKYLLVFTSISDQMEEMMDSLDKALAGCHDFVFAFNRDRAQQALSDNAPSTFPSTSESFGQPSWQSTEERLASLQTVKRSFNVKRSSYGPACEQIFASLEKGVKQHSTRNGTILRRFTELKTRWRSLRDRVSRMDKELKRIEAQLVDLGSDEAHHAATLTPSRSKDHLQHRQNRGSPLSIPHSGTTPLRSPPSGSLLSPNQRISPAARGSSLSPRPMPPVKPDKSIHRTSMLDLRKAPTRAARAIEHTRSSSLVTSQPVLKQRSGSISPAYDMIRPRTSSLAASSSPPTSYPRHVMERREIISVHPMSGSPSTSSPKTYMRTYTPQPMQSPSRRSRETDEDVESSAVADGEISLIEDEETLMSLTERMASPSPTGRRPSSAVGMYYRPPSSASQRSGETQSRIPRLSSTGTRPVDGSRRLSVAGGERPSSALSHASVSTTAYGRSPTHARLQSVSAAPPVSYQQGYEGAHRSSMQTPEPTIMARVQRMSLFGGGSKRSNRPPPTRYNATLYSSGQNKSSSSLGSAASKSSPQAKPLSVPKRQSGVWSANGRTTPLSAAALAKVPQAGIAELGFGSAGGPKARVISAGDGTYRTQRASTVANSYVPSAASGRETPTMSDGGHSSVWGGTVYGTRPSSRTHGGYDGYRPNPNDAIDVEVARVVNSLGVAIERVDPPLARGVKELDPSSSTLVRYQVGGKVIVCKLLQLVRELVVTPFSV